MTKKDYIIVAKCMNEVYRPAWELVESTRQPNGGLPETKEVQQALTEIFAIGQVLGKMFVEFAKDNPKFDWQKFKQAVYK